MRWRGAAPFALAGALGGSLFAAAGGAAAAAQAVREQSTAAAPSRTPVPPAGGGRCCPSPRSAPPAAATATPSAAAAAPSAEFELARLNRTYSQFVDQLEPVVLGPVEVLLRSPQHQLQLSRNQAWIEPAAEGTHRLRVKIELSGSGTINAVLRAAGLEGKLDDELTLPLQTLDLSGRIRLSRSAAGYQIALVEAPPSVAVRIQSQLAGRLVPVCRQMALVLVTFDCAALEEALSRVNVPLPAPGTEFLLPIEEVSPEEAKSLDAYLERAAEAHRRGCCAGRGPHHGS